jgi:hypothetical protein
MINTNFPPQSSKARSIKGFGENISQLSLCINVSHLNIFLLNAISQEVVSPLKVSHSLVKDWVFGYWYGTGVIAHEENDLSGGLCNRRLLVSWLIYKRRSEKMTNIRRALLVNPTTHKISIKKANKIKRRRSKIPNPKLRSVFEIPEDSLNCCPMWRVWHTRGKKLLINTILKIKLIERGNPELGPIVTVNDFQAVGMLIIQP